VDARRFAVYVRAPDLRTVCSSQLIRILRLACGKLPGWPAAADGWFTAVAVRSCGHADCRLSASPDRGRAIWSFAVVLVLALIGLGALYALYWLIRLAVRHGLDDARRQREQQAREESGWDPGRY
jgi:hypothetical protein